jgi:anthranilate phosphoribosyltransferase
MIREAIGRAVAGENLTEADMMAVMDEIMEGKATPAQIGAFMTALRIDARAPVVVDTCGTGGDGTNTFNISTTTAFVVAAAGITVAKHGNRAVSSSCGSADVLEALGVNIDAPPDVVEECLQQIGIGFLFAPRLHGAMKYAVGPRREIGIRTFFNVLGPLTNPAGATAQLLGVYEAGLTEMIASVLLNLGSKRAFVVHGSDGLDEATVTGETRVSEVREGRIFTYNIHPAAYFSEACDGSGLSGGDAPTNARITTDVLTGENGARRTIVLLNAALAEGIEIAAECIDSGRAIKKLQVLIELSHR